MILASNSPRRKDLLREFGFEFTIEKSDFEESNCSLSPRETVINNAFGKAKDVFDKQADKSQVILGADTVVSLDGNILGKPKTEKEAEEMLKSLSNRVHQVWTGYCIIKGDLVIKDAVQTNVEFNNLSDSLIKEYISTGKPMDKAGAYGIQDGFDLVKSFDGSFNNVVGLPIEIFEKTLKELL